MDQAAVTTLQDDDAPVRTTLRDGVGTIELSRPAVFNCLSQQMLSEISAAVATAPNRDGDTSTFESRSTPQPNRTAYARARSIRNFWGSRMIEKKGRWS